MKICRFDDDRTGLVRDDRIFDVTDRVGGGAFGITNDSVNEKSRSVPLEQARLLSPVRAPGKIIAAPVNYKAHVEEMRKSNLSPGASLDIDKAGLFMKAVSSLVGPSQG